jgi:hypothetical protein
VRTCLAVLVLVLSPLPALAQSSDADWLRRGDMLAASPEPGDLERALEAYAHVDATSPAYTTALERTAWVDFLLDRTTDAIARYVVLLDRLAPSPLRDEALVMLAAMFADLDWDHDGAIDADTPLARLSTLVPQDRAWLGELVYATAHALHLSSRDPAAITLLAHALGRWPAPRDGTSMEDACRRHRVRPATLHAESPSERSAVDAICARQGL